MRKPTIRLLAKQTLPTGYAGQRMYPDRSLFLFSENNTIRKLCKGLIEQRWFEYLVILTIIANCISLALEVHLPQRDRMNMEKKMAGLESIFLGIFTSEAILKIIALGFIFNKSAYLRNVWNILDFIVVTSGLITINLQADTVNLRTLRAIRVLRPFKLVSGVPSLQVVLASIIKAMAPLLQIGMLVLFAILIFAMMGLEIYKGIFHSTCWKIDSPLLQDAILQTCYLHSNTSCSPGYTCRPYWEGPFNGLVNFDNIGYAMLTVFQCITMEGWTDVLYHTNKANDSPWNCLYYVPLIVLGSFFMLNLVLGVLSGEFAKERERVEKRKSFLKLRESQKFQNTFQGYLDWIEIAGDILIFENKQQEEERKELLKNRKEARKWLAKSSESKQNIGEEDEEEDEDLKIESKSVLQMFMKRLKELRLIVKSFVKSQLFYWGVITLVSLNTVCVALEHYGQPEYLDKFFFYAEYVFLSIFMTEMFIKLYGFGFRDYFRSKFNVFDFFVIAVSLFEAVFQILKPNRSFGFSALRCIRLLRLLKLTRYWSSLRNLVFSLLSSMRSIISLILLLSLFIFILTLLGMQLFGGDFNFDQGKPSLNFDTFPNAIITVFVILTGENWNDVMYNGILSKSQNNNNKDLSMIYSAYFLVIVIVGNYTLLNVFLAIAVDNLANAAELSAAEEEEIKKEEKRREEAENEELRKLFGGQVRLLTFDKLDIPRFTTMQQDTDNRKIEDKKTNPTCKRILPYSSLFIFGPHNFIRRICHFVANLRFFDIFIMMVIFASSMSLAAEDPVTYISLRNALLEYFDLAFTTVFLIEMVLKVIDLGLILHPGSYMRDPWNIMDMIVVIIAVFSYFLSKNLNTIKSLRVIRVLRPLKTINRVPKLKAVFDTVINSVKNVFNILIVFILFQFIFGIIAVQLFSGKFFYCTDISKRFNDTCKGYYFTFTDQMNIQVKKRMWQRYVFNFDNIINSMITLFTVTTGEGWPDVLKKSIYSTFTNEGPIEDFKQESAIFYIVFFIVFPFFFVNIFVALIIVTFQEQGESNKTDLNLDKNQTKCIDFAINTKPTSRYMPANKNSIYYKIWLLVVSAPFEYLIMIIIALNSINLLIRSHSRYTENVNKSNFSFNHRLHDDLCSGLKYFNIAFTAIFAIECIFKLIAYQFKYYFKDPWNIFDFITVLGSIADVLITEIKTDESTTEFPNLGFLRLFRVIRLVKILMREYSLRILLWTFIQSFKSMPWVCLLIGLLFFIYCIIGMQIFGNIELNDETQINQNNNFRSFMMGLLLLFRCATGESWHLIMVDTSSGKKCACGNLAPNGTCLNIQDKLCGSDFAYPFFITFILVTTFLMLNLFVAVIMDNFDYLTRDSSILGPHHLDEFVRVWAQYDPMGTGWLHHEDMFKVMKKLEPPVGFGKNCPHRTSCFKLIRMNMVLDEQKRVNFNSTLFALIRESLQIKMGSTSEIDNLDQELRTNMLKVWPNLNKKNAIDTFLPLNKASYSLTVGKIYAGILIAKIWKDLRKYKPIHPINYDMISLTSTQYYFPCYRDYIQIESMPMSVSTDRISYYTNDVSNHSNINDEKEIQSWDEETGELNSQSMVIANSMDNDGETRKHSSMLSNFAEILLKPQQIFKELKKTLSGENRK